MTKNKESKGSLSSNQDSDRPTWRSKLALHCSYATLLVGIGASLVGAAAAVSAGALSLILVGSLSRLVALPFVLGHTVQLLLVMRMARTARACGDLASRRCLTLAGRANIVGLALALLIAIFAPGLLEELGRAALRQAGSAH